MSVKVAVRVRPFNQREIELEKNGCVVTMEGKQTILQKHQGKKREFAFDYSFWSHDGFIEEENGYLSVGQTGKYCDQQKVYQAVGEEVLDNAWSGYHCCLFAYGQTGSGKSYSMIGYGNNIGIVPISCEQIFKRINNNNNQNINYEVDVSMLEIYNEKIQDLMISTKKRGQSGLKVREHKLYGVYVEGLTKYKVNSYEEIDRKMEEGTRNRTVGATQMNQNSSRAHTIIRIEFKTKELIDGRMTEKLSVINLVDLAGSEKLSKTEASGDRFKEAVNINQSLTSLGLVISALAEQKKVVPFRDSQLTRILQNALGGNSKTLMICAISPAEDNYDETLSTLRYADQAKKIKCNAVVNESEQDKMIRQLKEENLKLKNMLEQLMKGGGQIDISQLGDIKQEMDDNNDFMKHQNTQSIQEKKEEQIEVDPKQAMFVNLNEDVMLSQKIKYVIGQQEQVKVGRQKDNDIVIEGLGIQNEHIRVLREGEELWIAECEGRAKEYTLVNGKKIEGTKVQLHHNDRLVLGTNTYLLYKAQDQQVNIKYDWDFLQQEIITNMQALKAMEIDQEIKKYKARVSLDRAKVNEEIQDLKEEYEQKLQLLSEKGHEKEEEEDIQQEAEEIKHEIQFMMDEQEDKDEQERDIPLMKRALEVKLARYYKMVQEMNLIAKTFCKDVILTSKVAYEFDEDDQSNETTAPSECQFKIEVQNNDHGYIYRWDLSKFDHRYLLVQQLMHTYMQTNLIPSLTPHDDPFYDPPEPELIGQTYIQLLNIPYIIENPCILEIISENKQGGQLIVNTIPSDNKGIINLAQEYDDQDLMIEEPEEMLGKSLYFNIFIEQISFNQKYNISDIYCQYSFMDSNNFQLTFKTPCYQFNGTECKLEYKQLHGFENVTQEILDYLVDKQICISIYGVEKLNDQKKQETSITQPMEVNRVKRQSIYNNNQMNQKVVNRRSTQLNLTPHQFNTLKTQQSYDDTNQQDKKKKNGCTIF